MHDTGVRQQALDLGGITPAIANDTTFACLLMLLGNELAIHITPGRPHRTAFTVLGLLP